MSALTPEARADAAGLLIHEARAIAEVLAWIGDVGEDHIPHMKTVAFIIAEKLEGAEKILDGGSER